MLTQRIVTALLLGPIFFLAIWLGTYTSTGVVFCGLALFFLYEYLHIIDTCPGREGMAWRQVAIYCLIGICPGVLSLWMGCPVPFWGWIYWYLIGNSIILLCRYGALEVPWVHLALTSFGHIYVGLFLYSILSIAGMDHSNIFLIYLFVCVFSGDIAAYFGGKTMGRHPLCPGISPKKTVEGALFGLLATTILGTLYMRMVFHGIGVGGALVISMILGASAQLGDILESIMKRTFHVKDSGGFLPGHGGFLDRFDGVILATPCLLLILQDHRWVM